MSLGRFTSAYTMSFLHKSHSYVSKFEGQRLVVRLYIYFQGIVDCIVTVTCLKRIKIYSHFNFDYKSGIEPVRSLVLIMN